uniref:transcription factor bHLH148-like n=1 Tax=Erigeron canadensis TaxID=72917 RepID=UPI001CB8B26E|nr:transcription factor bHLH148-like [Erigeron canadensis]
MESTSFIPNQITNNNCDSSKRRKRKKFQKHSNNKNSNNNCINQSIYPSWKSETQHQIYSSKLLQALRQVRANRSNNNNVKHHPSQDRAIIREAADRMLAVTAKGRTRWSRAILKNKLKLKFIKKNKRQRGLIAASATGNSRLKKPKVSILRLKTKNLPSIQRKARVLGGLVPGCNKQSLPVVLEEATDYIPALEMQVKAMAALVELLSGGSSSTAGSGILGHLSLNNRPSPNS